MTDTRLVGKVHRLPMDDTTGKLKGFGFLRHADGRDFFFHYTELLDGLKWEDLREGQAMTFHPVKTPRGWRATEIATDGHS